MAEYGGFIVALVGMIVMAFMLGAGLGTWIQSKDTDRWREKCFDILEHYRRIIQKEEGKPDD